MSETKEKPSEFWLDLASYRSGLPTGKWLTEKEKYETVYGYSACYIERLEGQKKGVNMKLIHLIEYSAYESLQKENEALKAEIERCKEIAERDGKVYLDIQDKLEKAKESLRFYSGCELEMSHNQDCGGKPFVIKIGAKARATLAEIEGEK